jgi:hypothetical protein
LLSMPGELRKEIQPFFHSHTCIWLPYRDPPTPGASPSVVHAAVIAAPIAALSLCAGEANPAWPPTSRAMGDRHVLARAGRGL